MTEAQYADQANRYRLDSRIAVGGMGVVWRGTDTRLDRPIAVKVLKAEYADDPTFRTRFEGEARSAAALHHPGIAGVYDYGAGEVGGHQPPYLVMELVDGQPLSTLLSQAKANDRTMDAAVVQDLIAQAGDALGVAHRAGIVHRDVKPANLLVTSDRVLKITDFGIARAADSVALTRTGSVMGTPQYLSPEQARGNRSTPASDVYSLGVVAFECLTGRRPFEADTPVATALAHLQQPVPELPDTVPAPLAAVVRRSLAKDPAERYADGAAFAAAFRDPSGADAQEPRTPVEGATQVLPVTPAQPTPVPQPSQPMERLSSPTPYAGEDSDEKRRSPWLIAILVVLLLVLVAVIAIALINRSDDDDEPAAEDTPSQTETSESSPTEPTSEETTPEETTTAPATVEVDDSSYKCNISYNVAAADLRGMNLQVSTEQDSATNDGSCAEGTVSRFSTNGTLNEGDKIVVYYWGPAEEPTEPTTPTDSTDTTDPTDLLPDTGGEG